MANFKEARLNMMGLKKTPFCKECKYYGGKTICLHPKAEGKRFEHIQPNFWCCYSEMKDKEVEINGNRHE